MLQFVYCTLQLVVEVGKPNKEPKTFGYSAAAVAAA